MSTSNLKISIAALSLCVSAVAIYIHLPYVIAAVSGSGAIGAVPLAIFAVSAIVALVSVICLIRLAVSRAGDKKKIDLSGEESGHTLSQEPQKLVHENSTNLESKPIEKEFDKSVKQGSGSQIKVDSGTSSQDKSSVPTSPSQSPQTCVTASSQVPQEKPVKQDSGSQIKVDSGTSSQDKSSVPTSPSRSTQTCDTAASQVSQEKPIKQDRGSQTEVDSDTSLRDKSSVPTSPSRSTQTCDAAASQVSHSVLPSPPSLPSGAVPPPPVPNSKAAKKSNNNGNQQPQDLVAVKKDSGSQTDVDRAISQNNNASSPSPSGGAPPPPPPPLPPEGLKNWCSPKNNTTGEKSPVGTTQENTHPRKKYEPPKDSKQAPVDCDTIINVRANLRKSVQPNNSIDGQQGGGGSMDDSMKVPQNRQDPIKELDAVQSNKGTDKSETLKERRKPNEQGFRIDPGLSKKLKVKRRLAAGDESDSDEHDSSANSPIVNSTSHNGETGSQNTDQSHREVSDSDVQGVSGPVDQNVIANAMLDKVNDWFHQSPNLQPGGERRSESPHGGYESGKDWNTNPDPVEQASSGSQSLHRERSGSLDSGHGSDDNVKSKLTSPLHSVPKGKPPVPLKPVNLKTKPEAPPAAQVNNVDSVNSEMQDPSTLPLKNRIKKFGGGAFPYQR